VIQCLLRGMPVTVSVSIVRTASTLPDAVVTNHEIGERLVADVQVDDEAAEAIVAKVRERSALIEKKTGLRARRFFDPGESPVTVGLELLERLMAGDAWSGLDALIVSSSSTHGFPGLSQQIVAAARARHADLGDPFVLDIGSNACTSFMYGVTIGASTLQTMGAASPTIRFTSAPARSSGTRRRACCSEEGARASPRSARCARAR
jgi:3-oxoacyl-[acyl-carrier-protein] synthase III